MATRFESFRNRVSSVFAGKPASTRQDGDQLSVNSRGRRLGFRLFPPKRSEGSQLPSHTDHGPSPPAEAIDAHIISSTNTTPTSQGSGEAQEPLPQNSPSSHGDSSMPSNGRWRYPIAWVRPSRKTRRNTARSRFRLGPGFKTREAKRKMISCGISGSILAIVLAVYMTLALTTSIKGREFHIFLILILMILTIYFCHSFVRLFMVASNCPSDEGPYDGRRVRFAEIDRPIHVRFARDEEIAASDTEDDGQNSPIASPPPAYGLWRGSMRINPNLIYWQRVEESGSEGQSSSQTAEPRPSTANRPPSYVSEDGVRDRLV
ncbi:hypothetical protein CISG_07535 [Coccidioides immitis RMSCC 3703]|uniref:Uncharacterized protein n=1 Tax=Coccidioides immitis RMSCC 3703 TaxID=454286 RepID=A0A0J8TYW9_COCIT|nr:hypothetical protein CISG_07535 [Coccidioides immitis RMSCC 3703]